MAATRFRDLERPTLIDLSSRTTSSGGSEAAAALSESLASFSRTSLAIADTIRGDIGTRVGAAEGSTGEPKFRKGFRALTTFGKAYNNSALRTYAIHEEIDLNENAARIEAEAGTDVEAFREAMTEMQKGVIEEAPEEARGLLAEIYNKRTGQGLARIQVRLSAELRAEDKAAVQEQTDQLTERIALLRAQDTPEAHFEAQEEEAKLYLMLDSAVNDFTLSESEGRMARDLAEQGIIFETVKARFINEINDPFGDPISFIEDLKEINRTADRLTPDQEAKLENELFAELGEHNRLAAARATQETAGVDARFEAGDREMTIATYSGEAGIPEILNAVDEQRLKPGRASVLVNEIQAGDPFVSDGATLLFVETNLLSVSAEDIKTNGALSWDDRRRLILKREEEAKGWRGEPNAREAVRRINSALDIPSEVTQMAFITEEQARAQGVALTEWFNEMIGVPDEERDSKVLPVAEEIIKVIVKRRDAAELVKARQTLSNIDAELAGDTLGETEIDVRERNKRTLENKIRELENGQQ